MNGISFRAPDSRMNLMEGMQLTQNIKTEDMFFWEIFGGKSYETAHAGRSWQLPVEKLGKEIGIKNVRFPELKHVGAFFSKLKFRVFCYS